MDIVCKAPAQQAYARASSTMQRHPCNAHTHAHMYMRSAAHIVNIVSCMQLTGQLLILKAAIMIMIESRL